MLNKQEWNQFESTGNITDYLSYKGVWQDTKPQEQEQAGESSYGSDYKRDRDHIISSAHRGI